MAVTSPYNPPINISIPGPASIYNPTTGNWVDNVTGQVVYHQQPNVYYVTGAQGQPAQPGQPTPQGQTPGQPPQPVIPAPSPGQSAQITGQPAVAAPLTSAQQLALVTAAYSGTSYITSASQNPYAYKPQPVAEEQHYITVTTPGGQKVELPVSKGFAEKYEISRLPTGTPPQFRKPTTEEEITRLYPTLGISGKAGAVMLALAGREQGPLVASQFKIESGQIRIALSEAAARPYLESALARTFYGQQEVSAASPGQQFQTLAKVVGRQYFEYLTQAPTGQLALLLPATVILKGAFGVAEAGRFGGAFEQTVVAATSGTTAISTSKMLASDISGPQKGVELATLGAQIYVGAKMFGEEFPVGVGKVEVAKITGRTVENPYGELAAKQPLFYSLYLKGGVEAHPIIGVSPSTRSIVIGKPNIVLPEGYVPVMDTALAREVGIASMKASGADVTTKGLELVIAKGLAFQPSKFISKEFSMMMQRFTPVEAEALKSFIMKQPEAYLFYGSAGEQAQLKPELRFMGHDVDLKAQLSYENTQAAAADMAKALSEAGGGRFRAPAKMELGEKPIVEKYIGGKWVKVIEIAPKEPLPGDLEAVTENIGEGFKAQAPIKVGGLSTLRLGEQLTRRYVAIGEPKYTPEGGYSFAPMERRAKDIPVFGIEAETLIASRELSLGRISPLYAAKTASLRGTFERLKAIKPEIGGVPNTLLLAKTGGYKPALRPGEYFKDVTYGLSGSKISYASTSAKLPSKSPSPSLSKSLSNAVSVSKSVSPQISKSPSTSIPTSPSTSVSTSVSASPKISPSISVSPLSRSISLSPSKVPSSQPPYSKYFGRQMLQYKEKKGEGRRLFRGFLKWRQGFVYRMWNPLTGESKATRKPMPGVAYARGYKSAYRSATLAGEYIPAAKRPMGIVTVGVGETLGTKPKLSFARRAAAKWRFKI